MNDLLARIFDTSRYTGLVEKERAWVAYGASVFMVIIAAIYITFYPVTSTGENLWQLAIRLPTIRFYVAFFYVMSLGTLVITRYGYAKLAGPMLVVMWCGSLVLLIVQNGLYEMTNGMTLSVIILLAGLLNRERGLIFGAIVAMAFLLLGLAQRAFMPPPTTINTTTTLFNALVDMAVIAGLTYMFLRYARSTRAEGATVAVQDRLKLAEIGGQITQRVAQRVPLADLLDVIVTHISAEFPDVYHAQVFLVEPAGDAARLVASTGEVGRQLIANQHSLGVGSLSVIGQATYRGAPIVARVGATDSVHRRNEFLPETASEAAFPLRIGNLIIGALDLQSKRVDAFPQEIVEGFLALAESIALAIDNVRQFERAEARIQENQQLVEQTRAALREVERLNERLTGRAWSEYLRGLPEEPGVAVDFEHGVTERARDWTNPMAEAVRFNHFVQEQQDDRQIIAIPLRVRGQVVGAMEFELDAAQGFAPEDLALVQEVSERFGLAAENTRLIQESQRIAQREALVNEISSRLQAANNIESTLDEAARSLRSALKASRVAIRLGTPPTGNGA